MLDLLGKESKDEVHSTPNKLHRRLAQPTTSCCLASKVILEPSIVRKREARVIDLQEVCDEVTFPDNQWRDLLEDVTENLQSNQRGRVNAIAQ